MEYIRSLINNKIVCVTCLGNSIEELEKRIDIFKKKYVVWVGLGQFDIIQDNILTKIKSRFSIVFDTATVPEEFRKNYEVETRLPRIIKYFRDTNDSLWLTSDGLVRDSIKPYMPDLLAQYQHKIIVIDNMFPKNNRRNYMEVPNSVCLLIGSLLYGRPKKIIIFGLDGYDGDPKQNLISYYKPDLVLQEHLAALGQDWDPGIKRDTKEFIDRFSYHLRLYEDLFNHRCEIYNCSPKSLYTVPQKITYDDLESITKV